jgi:hypothetical protein
VLRLAGVQIGDFINGNSLREDVGLAETTEDAKRRAMKALSQSALSASGIGFVAFPNGKFRTPQAAASAGSKLRRDLMAAGLIDFDQTNSSYTLSSVGRQWVAKNLL